MNWTNQQLKDYLKQMIANGENLLITDADFDELDRELDQALSADKIRVFIRWASSLKSL